MIFVYLLMIVLAYFSAKCFYEVAEKKGHHDKKYFWICLFFSVVGWLLVIALPDRGESGSDKSSVIPPDTQVAGFTSGAMEIPRRKDIME